MLLIFVCNNCIKTDHNIYQQLVYLLLFWKYSYKDFAYSVHLIQVQVNIQNGFLFLNIFVPEINIMNEGVIVPKQCYSEFDRSLLQKFPYHFVSVMWYFKKICVPKFG